MAARLAALFLVITALLLGAYYFLGNKTTGQKVQNNLTSANDQKSVILPVSPNAPGIEALRITYNFAGKIRDLRPSGTDFVITLDSNTPDIPTLTTNSQTAIAHQSGSIVTKGEWSDLKKGLDVSIQASYLLKEKTWRVEAVAIRP